MLALSLRNHLACDLLPINCGAVHLWLCDDDENVSHEVHHRGWSLLSKEEKAQSLRFYFAKDRNRYLLTRALIRTVLSRYAKVSPSEWQFEKAQDGRPYVVGEKQQEVSHLSFNISHTDGLIIVGIANGVEIGVDVENTNRAPMLEIANRVFSVEEASRMQTLSKEEQRRYFFALWTLKESYVKARGVGLRLPFKQIAFEWGNDSRINPCFNPEVNDVVNRWKFLQLYPSDHHVAAICVEWPMMGDIQLTCRKSLPLCWEEAFVCTPIRESK